LNLFDGKQQTNRIHIQGVNNSSIPNIMILESKRERSYSKGYELNLEMSMNVENKFFFIGVNSTTIYKYYSQTNSRIPNLISTNYIQNVSSWNAENFIYQMDKENHARYQILKYIYFGVSINFE
jgi:hypothetical protein